MEALEAPSVEPEDSRLLCGRLYARREALQFPGDGAEGGFDGAGLDDSGAESVGQSERGGAAHPRQDPGGSRAFVGTEDLSLRLIAVDDGGRMTSPVRMLLQEELERKIREVNTGHPVHGRPPRASSRDRAACPSRPGPHRRTGPLHASRAPPAREERSGSRGRPERSPSR
jgi:hypothetical protein